MKVFNAQAPSPLHKDRCDDYCATYSHNDLHCVVVCDGVSSCSDGQAAASIAANTIIDLVKLKPYKLFENPRPFFEGALFRIRGKLLEYAKKNALDSSHLGSTISCVIWENGKFVAMSLGDSPIVIMRNGIYHILDTRSHPNGHPYTYSTVDLLMKVFPKHLPKERITKKERKILPYVISKGKCTGAFVFSDGAYTPLAANNCPKIGGFKNNFFENIVNVASFCSNEEIQQSFDNLAKKLSDSSLDDATFALLVPAPHLRDLIEAQCEEFSFRRKADKKKLVNTIYRAKKICKTCNISLTFSVNDMNDNDNTNA